MSQLALNIATRLAYEPQSFLVHAGVRDGYQALLGLAALSGFRLAFVVGTPRSGKTHFSIRLMEDLVKAGVRPRLLDGDLFASSAYPIREKAFSKDDFLVIDDADRYLEKLRPGDSGEIVAFIEKLRVAGAALVLFGSKEVDDYAFDDHAGSRLAAAIQLRLQAPGDSEVQELLRLMARQRGFSLDQRQIDYLVKRLDRSIAGIENYLDRLISLSRVRSAPVRFPLLSDAV
jgi:chromosomal replication initiation ATPase DnaA